MTNTPIIGGDEVYAFILVQNPWGISSFTNPTVYYAPIPYFIEGKYDDYGGMNNCKSPTLDLILSFIKDRLDYDDGSKMDTENFFRMVHEDRLYLKNPHYNYSKTETFKDRDIPSRLHVKHIMVRKDVFQKFLSDFKMSWTDWSQEKPRSKVVSYRDMQKHTSEYVKQLYNDSLEIIECKKQIDNAVDLPTNEMMLLQLKLARLQMANMRREMKQMRMFDNHQQFTPLIHPRRNLDATIIDDNELLLNALVEQCTQTFMLCSYMDLGRMMWIPQSGEGGQDCETDAQELRGKLTQFAAKQIKKRWEE